MRYEIDGVLDIRPVALEEIPESMSNRPRVKQLFQVPWAALIREVVFTGQPHAVTAPDRGRVNMRSSAVVGAQQLGLEHKVKVLLRDQTVYLVPRDQWDKREEASAER